MERYTYFEDGKWRLRVGDTEYSGPWVDRLASYEVMGMEPGELSALVKAQDEGRVVELPVNPNTEVWAGRCKEDLHRCWYASQAAILDDIERGYIIRSTRAEAEAALSGQKGEEVGV